MPEGSNDAALYRPQADKNACILVNRFADQMLYERDLLAGNLPFGELKAQVLIINALRKRAMRLISRTGSAPGSEAFEGEFAVRA
jgi:hypothetical protein